jgi:Xaa-Pro aminopeptidase
LTEEYARTLSPTCADGHRLVLHTAPTGTTLIETLCALVKKLTINHLYFESSNLTVSEFDLLKKYAPDGTTFSPKNDTIEQLRTIKNEVELSYITAACRLTDRTFVYIKTLIKPGVTEWKLQQKIIAYIHRNGGGIAFTPIVAFGAHASMPHYGSDSDLMKTTVLKKNDTILFDFGASYNGYCSDMTRTIAIGYIDPAWKHAYDAVLQSHDEAIAYLQLTRPCFGDIADTTARNVIANKKLTPYMHSLGHALGLDIHETPRLTKTKHEPILPGMVITIEPGVYVPGAFGIRIEDTVYMTQSGIAILTKSPTDGIS